MDKSILDACCGSKMFWFNKREPHTVYCDKRRVQCHEYYPGRYLEVAPDMQCDFRYLPFQDETFWHVIFDPPHMIHAGKASWTREKYGVLDANWPEMLHDGFDECWRVLKTNGTLIFKWSSIQIPLSELLKHIDHKPLYGHKSGKHSNTHWLAFVKFEDDERKDINLFENIKEK